MAERELEGRTVIVTGASSGIGRAIALRFAGAGANIVAADLAERPWHDGEPTVTLIRRAGGSALFTPCDLADTAAVEGLVPLAVERFGRLDVVVNNAAVNVGAPMTETSDAAWQRVLAVNVTAPFVLSRAAVAHMRGQEPRGEVRGRIVNVTSQHGLVAAPEDVAYGVSKAALIQLTRQVAVEFAPDGIVCNAVAPGKIDTGHPGRTGDPRWERYWASRTPWPRLGRPDDVAGAALFLAGDGSTYMTGVNLMVDGGWMAN